MSSLFTLLSLSLVMAMASFLPGLLPLSFSMSPSQLRLITTIGTGVLIGTSLIVVIPEGVDTLYSIRSAGSEHVKQASTSSRPAFALQHKRAPDGRSIEEFDPHIMPGPVLPDPGNLVPAETSAPPQLEVDLEGEGSQKGTKEDGSGRGEEQHRNESPHAWIGIALISGFILMFLIEKLPMHIRFSKPTNHPHHIFLNDLGRRLVREHPSNHDDATEESLPDTTLSPWQSRSFATTTGLVIHATADGIALGASSSAANNSLSFIVFFAIMLHKAPAAFGLSSALLKQGLSKRTARAHLLLFSLAAPTGAILTWLFAHTWGSGSVNTTQDTTWWTAMLLLFSAGTFLYVAMHTMQQVGGSHQVQVNEHGDEVGEERYGTTRPVEASPRDAMFAVIGMALPLFLQLGHAH